MITYRLMTQFGYSESITSYIEMITELPNSTRYVDLGDAMAFLVDVENNHHIILKHGSVDNVKEYTKVFMDGIDFMKSSLNYKNPDSIMVIPNLKLIIFSIDDSYNKLSSDLLDEINIALNNTSKIDEIITNYQLKLTDV